MLDFTTNLDGQPEKAFYRDEDFLTYQLLVTIDLKLGKTIKAVICSASRNDTSYQIFDENGQSMGVRRFTYASSFMHRNLVEDLNVLFEEFGVEITPDDLAALTYRAVTICETRFGASTPEGDVHFIFI